MQYTWNVERRELIYSTKIEEDNLCIYLDIRMKFLWKYLRYNAIQDKVDLVESLKMDASFELRMKKKCKQDGSIDRWIDK